MKPYIPILECSVSEIVTANPKSCASSEKLNDLISCLATNDAQ